MVLSMLRQTLRDDSNHKVGRCQAKSATRPTFLFMPFDRRKFAERMNTLVKDQFDGDNQRFVEAWKKLSKAATKSDTMVGRYRKGLALPRLDTLAVMAGALGVSTDYLAGLSESEKPAAELNQQRAVREDAAEYFGRSVNNDQRPPLKTAEFMGGVFEIAGNKITIDLIVRGPDERAELGRFRPLIRRRPNRKRKK